MNGNCSNTSVSSIKWQEAALLAALLVIAALALWPVLMAPKNSAPGLPEHDARTQWYPWRAYAAQNIREGRLPLWNPYVLCGTPFLGNFQSALFYPPNVVFLIAPIGVAARVSIFFHIWLSMVFAYLLARFMGLRLASAGIAAISYSFCAAQILRVPAGHWGISCAIPWLPLIVLCAEWTMRRPEKMATAIAACAVAMQILSGAPQYVFISCVATAIFAFVRGFGAGLTWKERVIRWLAVAAFVALGGALAAVQLLPGLEATAHGTRSLPMRPEWVEQFSLGPENLLTLLVPGFFGGAENSFYWGRFLYWEMNCYVGIVALGLALVTLAVGRPKQLVVWFAALAVATLLLALGRHTPLMDLLVKWLPLGGMFRGSAKFLLPFSLAVALLAGAGAQAITGGLDCLDKADESPRVRLWRVALPLFALSVALGILLALTKNFVAGWPDLLLASGECLYRPGPGRTPPDPLPAFRSVLLSLIFALTLLAVSLVFWRARRAMAAALLVLAAADGILFARSFIGPWAMFEAAGSAWPEGAGQFVRATGSNGRVWALRMPQMNDAMLERAPVAEGIEPNPPARFHRLFRRNQGLPEDVAPSLYQLYSTGPQSERLGIRWALMPDEMVLRGAPAAVWRGAGWSLLEAPSPAARGFIVHQAIRAPAPEDALEMTLSVDVRTVVVLEEQVVQPNAPYRTHGETVRILSEGPNHIALSAELGSPGWLVLLDNWFPGWKAEVDGRPARILRADYAFRAIRLERGKHEILLRYRPTSLYWGCVVSGAALICLVLLLSKVRLCGHSRKGGLAPANATNL